MNLYPFGKAVTYPVVHALFSIRYEGLDTLPQQGGYILACNHRSNFDPLFIAHRLPHPIHYLAKEELTQPPVIGPIISSLGIVPIKRGSGDTGALGSAAALIREGGVLGMFPEGHRSKDGKPLRPRSGIALIAGQTGADILPCAVCYGDRLGFRTRVIVRYGTLIPHEALNINLESPATLKAASRRIMDDIIALLHQGDGENLQENLKSQEQL